MQSLGRIEHFLTNFYLSPQVSRLLHFDLKPSDLCESDYDLKLTEPDCSLQIKKFNSIIFSHNQIHKLMHSLKSCELTDVKLMSDSL